MPDWHIECTSYPKKLQCVESPRASLDLANHSAVEIGFLGQLFLGEVLCQPGFAYSLADLVSLERAHGAIIAHALSSRTWLWSDLWKTLPKGWWQPEGQGPMRTTRTGASSLGWRRVCGDIGGDLSREANCCHRQYLFSNPGGYCGTEGPGSLAR